MSGTSNRTSAEQNYREWAAYAEKRARFGRSSPSGETSGDSAPPAREGAPAGASTQASASSHSSPRPEPVPRELVALVDDLLANLPGADRPVVRRVAEQAARSIDLVGALAGSIADVAMAGGKSGKTNVDLMERLIRMKALEATSSSRLLLILELLQHRRLAVAARPVPLRRAHRRTGT